MSPLNQSSQLPQAPKEYRQAKSMSDNLDFEVRSLDTMGMNESQLSHPAWHLLKYLAMGFIFGLVLVKAEVVSWYRIQEMFRFESFHMYGVIGSAVVVGAISIALIKKFKWKTIYGEPVRFYPKKFSIGQVLGGLLFGFGWAMTGACPGPLYALIGSGTTVIVVSLFSAIVGTWVYGWMRQHLPH